MPQDKENPPKPRMQISTALWGIVFSLYFFVAFRMQHYSGESEDELGFKLSTIEEYIGSNPVPVYLGDKYEDKLRPKVTLCKNINFTPQKNMNFSEKECRWILRELSGIRSYQWMKVVNSDDMDEEVNNWHKYISDDDEDDDDDEFDRVADYFEDELFDTVDYDEGVENPQ